jgi:hypothetical protein
VTVVVLWIYFYVDSLGSTGLYTVLGSGLMPIGIILPASAAVLVLVSLVTSPPPDDVVRRFDV